MENIKELYILGKPIDTNLGRCYFIKVKEYDNFLPLVPYLKKQKEDIIKDIVCMLKKSKISEDEIDKLIKDTSELTLLQLIYTIKLDKVYNQLFNLCFQESKEMFYKIKTDEEFEFYRDLIRNMNCIKYEKPNPNNEIEKFNQYKRLYNKKCNGEITLLSIITSVEVFTGENANEMTIYKLNALFNRIYHFKIHDRMVVKTVFSDMRIPEWYEEDSKEEVKQLDEESKKIISNFKMNKQNINAYKSVINK